MQPYVLKDAVLTIAEDDFTAAISQAVFVPQVLWEWRDALCSTTSTPVYKGFRWTVTLSYLQDLTDGSLTLYLLEHVAETKEVIFTPVAGGKSLRADVMIVPGQVGGVTNQLATATATMPLFDTPELGTVV